MTKTKVFIFLALAFLSISTLKAQTNVDSVSFEIDTTLNPILRVGFRAFKYEDGAARAFTSLDTFNFDFTWTFDGVTVDEPLPSTVHIFPNFTPNPHQIIFEADSSGTVFRDTILLPLYDYVRIPNVFTPTQSPGDNDLFIVRSSGNSVLSIKIYSKTGSLVFEQEGPVIVWDGKKVGSSESDRFHKPGVYFYVLQAQDNSIQARKGVIYLY